MRISIVIGAGWGDEGKGLVTAALAMQDPNSIVVRYGGGQQCGHTVVREDGLSHVCSNFGSGSMYGVPTYWSKHCTIDPFGMMNEYNILKKKGITPKLYIDPMAMVTTPYDITWNQFLDNQQHHGTCGVGFGATIQRNKDNYHLNAMDMLYPYVFLTKMDLIKKNYGEDVLEDYYSKLDHHPIPFLEAVEWLLECPDVIIERHPLIDYDHIICEGHQGILLDKDFGFFPHVTHSSTTIQNAQYTPESFSLSSYSYTDIYYVTRAYQTRHGNGPMSNEDKKLKLINTKHESNITNKHQGSFRTGLLDMDLLKYAIECNRSLGIPCKEKLVVTCVDQLESQWRYTQDRTVKMKPIDSDVWEKALGINDVYFSYSPYAENLDLCKTMTPQTISSGRTTTKKSLKNQT